MTSEEKETLCDRAFREGAAARLEGRLEDALRLFRQSLEECPPQDRKLLGGINGMIGAVERKRGSLTSAEKHSRIATTLLPRSQLASVGMFHSLWDQEKRREALDEVIRLVSLRDSEHYSELLSHGFRDDLGVELLALADRARAILSGYVDENK